MCRRLRENAHATLSLSLFAHHVANETSGEVKLFRLPDNHHQKVRCCRAVKAGSERELDILNIYKLENKPVLAAFQKAANAQVTANVKGLLLA